MEKIVVPLAEGFEEIEAVSIIDVLRRAEFDVIIASVTGNTVVTGSHKIKVTSDLLFNEVNFSEVDMFVLPGGMPGAENLKKHEGLRRKLTEFNKNKKPLAAICAAPIVLGDLGILENKTATCYPGYEDGLKGANVTDGSVEHDGNIITGRGAGVAVKFALKIVEVHKGKQFAEKLAEKMVVEK